MGDEVSVKRRWGWPNVLGWVVLVGAVVLPPHGSGIPMCPSNFMTGVPCPGCGLTRSVGCLVHGEFGWSWHYHPFGAVALVAAAMFGAAPFTPLSVRGAIRRWAGRRRRTLELVGFVALGVFLIFGAVRMSRYMLGDHTILAGPAPRAGSEHAAAPRGPDGADSR